MGSEELVEVVDRQGRVRSVVSRSQMRAENLRHRCVYVVVVCETGASQDGTETGLSADARVIVHQRAAWKDTYPNYWDLAFGGVCAVGEGWTAAAHRELQEEAGLSGLKLTNLGSVDYSGSGTVVTGEAFTAFCDLKSVSQLSNTDGEAVAFASIRARQLPQWLAETKVCPDTAAEVVPALMRVMKNL